MRNKVFDYIEDQLVNKSRNHVSFHTWGDDENREMYYYLNDKIKLHPVMKYNGRT